MNLGNPIIEMPLNGLFYNCIAKIRIFARGKWDIEIYFNGPDLRYNGDLVYISDKMIDKYISGAKENWEELKKMKALNLEGTYTKKGRVDMLLSVKDARELCLYVFHKYEYGIIKSAIRNETQLNSFISNLENAKRKVEAAGNNLI